MIKVILKTKARSLLLGTIENRIFTKTNVSGKIHMYREIPSWGIDMEIFHAVIKPEADVIKVFDTDSDIGYKITTKKFEAHSTEREFGDHRKQLFCSVVFFHKYHKNGRVELPIDEMGKKPEEKQTKLC